MNAVVGIEKPSRVVNKIAATNFCFQSVSEVDLAKVLNDLPAKLFILKQLDYWSFISVHDRNLMFIV